MSQMIKGRVILPNGNTFEFTDDDIDGDVIVSSQCVSGNAVSLGSVCSAECSMTFIIEGVNRYDMIGAVINAEVSHDNETWQQIGIFNVATASRHYNHISVTAYDNMMLLDNTAFTSDENEKKVNQISQYLQTERSIYDVLNYVISLAGLELGNAREEIEAMPNGQRTTILYSNNENAYLRDWLSWSAELLGGFAYADENGKIVIKQFESLPSLTITNSDISLDTSDIADFRIKNFDIAVTCYDERWYKTFTVLNDGESQNTVIYIDLADNPLVQGFYHLVKQRYSDEVADGETESARTLQMFNFTGEIWDALANRSFRPFSATVHIEEMLEIGQCVQIQDAEGDFYSVLITHHTWTLNGGQQIKCIGEDTRLLADYKNRSAIKRESEKLKTQINLVKCIEVTSEEFMELYSSGQGIEGATYYIY